MSRQSGGVLHVLTALDFGGVESQMRLIAAHAQSMGRLHAFCAIGPGGAVLRDLQAMGAQAHALNCKVAIPSPWALFGLWRHIRRLRPEIVHLHGAEANFHGAIAARLARVRVVLAEEVGVPRHSARARRIFAWAYRRCDRVIAISEAVKAEIVALGEAEAAKIEVIYNPFEPQSFRPSPPRGDRLEIGFVGRLEPVKNPMAAVEAMALLRARGIAARLHLIGDGSQRQALEQRIAGLDLDGAVVLAGFQPRPFDHLHDCHLYLQPSLTEGFGLAICEAMSAGLPAIATAVGGVPEIIQHGRTGWLLADTSPQAIADMIEVVQRMETAEIAAVAARGASMVRERFGVATYMAHCARLYDRLAGSGAGGRSAHGSD